MLCVLFEKERSKETVIAATVVREEAEAATATIVAMATGVRAHDARIIVAIVRAHHRARTPSTVIVAIVRAAATATVAAAATATVAAAAVSTAHDDAVVAAIVRCDGREEASTDRPEQTTGRACGRVANHALLLLLLRRRSTVRLLLLLLLLMRRVGRLQRSSVRLLLLLLLLLLRVGRLLGVGCCADLLRRRGSRYCGQPHLERLTRRNALRDR